MHVKIQTDEITDYLTDASNMPGGYTEKVFVPETKAELAQILAEANEAAIPVTISGARTGTVGGAVPFGGVVISLEKFRNLEIDKAKMRAIVGAGVVLRDLQVASDREDLFYPPDPTEWSAQLGGTVATNASGARSFLYGSTRNFVERLEIAFPEGDSTSINRGEIVSKDGWLSIETNLGRTIRVKLPTYEQPDVRKNTSGFVSGESIDAIDLFIGSEGVIGVITEIEFRLLPKPEGFLSGIVFFAIQDDLLRFVAKARELSYATRLGMPGIINATTLEYFDYNSLELIRNKFPETPETMAGAIFFEQETTPQTEDALFESWNNLLEEYSAEIDKSWFAINEQDLVKMREFRHALPVAVNEKVVKNGQRKVGTDMAVPDKTFESFLNFYQKKLSESGLDYVIFGHIGDCHLHANILPRDENEMKAARHLYGRFIAQAVMLGGTVSAEHGIGKLKSKYLYVMFGERYINEMIEVKNTFDPKGILGRDNLFNAKSGV